MTGAARSRWRRLRRTLRLHPVLSAISALAGLVCLAFVIRFAVLLWHGDDWAARPIEGWMTPGYLVRVYDLPPDALSDLFGVAPGAFQRKPLSQIARDLNLPLSDLIAALDALRRP